MKISKHILSTFLIASVSSLVHAQNTTPSTAATSDQPVKLEPVVVAAKPGDQPLQVSLDARADVQPIPAQDGADYLKSIPGFSVIRKGGTDGDPVLRGQAGSRLNILLDGQNIFGGCGSRMDPPTAYVFPAAYDRVIVIKGPQTVLYGPGATAGVVLFERDIKRFTEPGAKLEGSLTLGSFGRHDEATEVRAGVPDFYVQGSATRTTSGDYEDGAGNKVHSNYRRWSTNAAVGWTPDEHTSLELSGARSNGRAAYADRSMDGSKFLRENVGLSFKKYAISTVIQKIELSGYYNYADHIMDNYTLRPAPMMPMLMNPDRKTAGGRAEIDLAITDTTSAKAGIDLQNNRHAGRMSLTDPYVRDASFEDKGLFTELTQKIGEGGRAIAGLRADGWTAEDDRATISIGSGMMGTDTANPTANAIRKKTLFSGFGRFEQDLPSLPVTVYAGVGVASRFPDYWELLNKESVSTISSFNTKHEQNTQLDIGAHYKKDTVSGSFSLFANKIENYILVQTNYSKPTMMGSRSTTIVRNIDAATWGAEASLAYQFLKNWTADASLAFVEGNNETEKRPLAQQPPLEARFGLSYTTEVWSFGALTRAVARQDRFALNEGNIVGQDLGSTGGFTLFSLNGSWNIAHYAKLSAGVDNLFNKTYAEFISHGGAAVTGYTQTTRVNEPGRTLWAKLTLRY
jgi:iron complex outermembrane receptor protein